MGLLNVLDRNTVGNKKNNNCFPVLIIQFENNDYLLKVSMFTTLCINIAKTIEDDEDTFLVIVPFPNNLILQKRKGLYSNSFTEHFQHQ